MWGEDIRWQNLWCRFLVLLIAEINNYVVLITLRVDIVLSQIWIETWAHRLTRHRSSWVKRIGTNSWLWLNHSHCWCIFFIRVGSLVGWHELIVKLELIWVWNCHQTTVIFDLVPWEGRVFLQDRGRFKCHGVSLVFVAWLGPVLSFIGDRICIHSIGSGFRCRLNPLAKGKVNWLLLFRGCCDSSCFGACWVTSWLWSRFAVFIPNVIKLSVNLGVTIYSTDSVFTIIVIDNFFKMRFHLVNNWRLWTSIDTFFTTLGRSCSTSHAFSFL